MDTLTSTATKAVSNTKLAVATLALFVAGGAALAVVPVSLTVNRTQSADNRQVVEVAAIGTNDCGSTWSKIFEGTIVPGTAKLPSANWYIFNVKKSVNLKQLDAMRKNGCSFKVVRDDAAGGGSGGIAYECLAVGTMFGDNIFSCDGPKVAPNGKDEFYLGLNLGFDGNKVYLVPLLIDADPVSVQLSVFVKK